MTERNMIAIGMDEKNQLWNGHFGEAPWYGIYSPEGNLIENRINPYREGGEEEREHGNPAQIVELLSECGVFIGLEIGNPKGAQKMGVQPVTAADVDPQKALAAYLKEGKG